MGENVVQLGNGTRLEMLRDQCMNLVSKIESSLTSFVSIPALAENNTERHFECGAIISRMFTTIIQ